MVSSCPSSREAAVIRRGKEGRKQRENGRQGEVRREGMREKEVWGGVGGVEASIAAESALASIFAQLG